MFSGGDMFDTGGFPPNPLSGSSRGVRHASAPCAEHEVAPVPIHTHAEHGDPFTVLQFRPAWGLQLYLRFVRCPYVVRNLEYPSLETAGRLPVLVDGQCILPEEDAFGYLCEHYPALDLDGKLSGAKRTQVAAFQAVVRETLAPALGASRYRDERNFVQNVRAVVLQATRFPLGQSVANAERKRGLEEQRWRGLLDGGLGMGEVLARAHGAYRELDNWLGASTGDFFFGREPTSFDACLFGHLAEALADVNLLVLVTTLPNLMRFFRRIAEEFFHVGTEEAAAASSSAADAGFRVPSALKEFYRRADYVNNCNAFNQVDAAKLCAQAPLVPEPMVQKFIMEEKDQGHGGQTVAGTGRDGATAGVGKAKKKEELEEDRARQKENVLWLSAVGGVVTLFMLFQAIIALATGEIQVVQDGDDEGEGTTG